MSTETEKKKKRKEKFEKNFNILTKKNYTELSEKQKEALVVDDSGLSHVF